MLVDSFNQKADCSGILQPSKMTKYVGDLVSRTVLHSCFFGGLMGVFFLSFVWLEEVTTKLICADHELKEHFV